MRNGWLTVALAAALLPLGSAAQAAEVHAAPLKALKIDELAALRLKVGAEPYTEPQEDTFSLVTLDQVLSGDDRITLPTAATPAGNTDMSCADRLMSFGPLIQRSTRAFCWDTAMQGVAGTGNENKLGWVPQGLATSGEAANAGAPVPTGKDALITSWNWQNPYSHPLGNSVRLSVVNLQDNKYRNVLPVWVGPDGNLNRVFGHGGGLAWSGPYLFMATTPEKEAPRNAGPDAGRTAIRVFDTRKIYFKASTTSDYRYVMPEVAHYVFEGAGFDLAYISLDRTDTGERALVVGSYENSTASGTPLAETMVARYAFRSAPTGDYRIWPTPTAAWQSKVPATGRETDAISDVQGVQMQGKLLYFNMSGGYFQGSTPQRRFALVDTGNMTVVAHQSWGCRGEDLSLWYDEQNPAVTTGELWGITEGEQQRVVYSVKQSELASGTIPGDKNTCAPPRSWPTS